MKKLFCILFYGCLIGAWATSVASEPSGESTVIGGIVVELYGNYFFYNEPQRVNLPIRIAVEFINEKSKPQMYAYNLNTDANGYFKIENAPAGKYIVKAVELNVGQSVHITAASEFGRWQKGERYRFWGLLSGMMYRNEHDLIETIFENEPASGVIDLGITYLKIKCDERYGGTPFKNYSPNGVAPWVRMSLGQGYKNADLAVVEYKTFAKIEGLKMQEVDLFIDMISPSLYFAAENK